MSRIMGKLGLANDAASISELDSLLGEGCRLELSCMNNFPTGDLYECTTCKGKAPAILGK